MNDQRESRKVEAAPERYDVAILGGGLAGLTLALQLRQTRPDIKIVVVERQKHPVPEAAHKVGESTVELAAYYLRDVLGLGQHLQTQQLRKFGLRMFFSAGDNRDITRRVEYGQIIPAPLPTYQLDRGRFENALGCELLQQGVAFLDSCKVQKISLQPQSDAHRLRVLDEAGGRRDIHARWVVDASGRTGLLKQQLGLAKKVGHVANAVWFRVGHPIDINDWSDDPQWQARVRGGDRQLSTNHLMGEGYWVWLIRLASDSISIGIVADASLHPFEKMNRFDRAMAWLHKYEPQCAEVIEQHRDKIQDFRVMKDYSYSCEQVFSNERWCLTGEAGVAVDPLYSPGSDLIAISNGLICDLIDRDLNGENIEELAAVHNRIYLILAEVWLLAYEDQYPLFGNAQVTVAKVIWDTIIYWAFPGLLYFHDKIRTLGDSPMVLVNLYRCWTLHKRVQAFFREWHAIDQPVASDAFADPYSLLDFMLELHSGMAAGLPDAELEAQFAKNVRLLEQLAGQLVSTVAEKLADRTESEATQSQIQRWLAEPLLKELIAVYRQEQEVNPIDSSWITLGQQSRERLEVAL
jgi:2-polyprenyl-6-methoxyphenol hydroxylase-like FAD-dependent oxidoreductase